MFFDVKDLKEKEIFLKITKTCEAEPEKRYFPAYHFDICLLDGTSIGHCDLRIGHNEKTYIGGNIGYGIDEQYRGHHYAAKACQLLFKQAKKHDMNYLIITCVTENIASSRTCEIAGGKFLEIVNIPEDNEMYIEGKRQVKIFRFNF
ncbi:GNAT family N-acetyltransferase [uncultured Clostridium sp.]|uniref:GNAT family N-acetyltransferase n=1 Tax=uncultured Clostridium sp. TaxID=59620 RepID=UPI0026209097|nr:GNAT family N-acetyltransferase [uncultured Clostridium sp.]